MFTITGQLDVTYACEYLATCSTHPKDWKCTVSGHPIDCYQCIKRESLAKFKTNHDTLKILTSGIKAEVPGDQKENTHAIAEAIEVMVLTTSFFGFLFSVVTLIRIYRGGKASATSPSCALLAVSLIPMTNMIVDLMT